MLRREQRKERRGAEKLPTPSKARHRFAGSRREEEDVCCNPLTGHRTEERLPSTSTRKVCHSLFAERGKPTGKFVPPRRSATAVRKRSHHWTPPLAAVARQPASALGDAEREGGSERPWLLRKSLLLHVARRERSSPTIVACSRGKTLFILSELGKDYVLWFANIVNYLVSGYNAKDFNYNKRKRFLHDVRDYFWDEPLLFKRCVDGIVRRCIPEEEFKAVASSPDGGPDGGLRTAVKRRQWRLVSSAALLRWRRGADERRVTTSEATRRETDRGMRRATEGQSRREQRCDGERPFGWRRIRDLGTRVSGLLP
nr:Integrase, catalytic core [Ipomoea batatas]